jgi:hypothetical protein
MTTLIALIIVLSVLAYLIVGTLYARHAVAVDYQERKRLGPPDLSALDDDTHKHSCDWVYYAHSRECDCYQWEKWEEARRRSQTWDDLTDTPVVKEPYGYVFWWPVYLHKSFVLANAGVESRRDRRHRIEIENAEHIARVTAIVNSNQREINVAQRSSLDIVDEAEADLAEHIERGGRS